MRPALRFQEGQARLGAGPQGLAAGPVGYMAASLQRLQLLRRWQPLPLQHGETC